MACRWPRHAPTPLGHQRRGPREPAGGLPPCRRRPGSCTSRWDLPARRQAPPGRPGSMRALGTAPGHCGSPLPRLLQAARWHELRGGCRHGRALRSRLQGTAEAARSVREGPARALQRSCTLSAARNWSGPMQGSCGSACKRALRVSGLHSQGGRSHLGLQATPLARREARGQIRVCNHQSGSSNNAPGEEQQWQRRRVRRAAALPLPMASRASSHADCETPRRLQMLARSCSMTVRGWQLPGLQRL